MSRINLELDVAKHCRHGSMGHLFMCYYFAPVDPSRLVERTLLLKGVLSPEELIHLADKDLVKNHPFIPSKGALTAASCVMRLCTEHPQPQMEVEEKIIKKKKNYNRYPIKLSPGADKTKDGDGLPIYIQGLAKGVSGNDIWLRGRAFYLPMTGDYDVTEAVISDRGGSSQPVVFGLTGDETILGLPTRPRLNECTFPAR